MKNVLFTASVASHIAAFHLPYLEWFKNEGHRVDVAASGSLNLPFCDNQFNIPNVRNPFSMNVIKGYKELKQIISSGHYDIIHCHTPVASILTRLAARKARKHGTKVIYTAHGFHFFKGAPLENWLIYFPIEWLCSFVTDVLITINKEDYQFAKKHIHAKKIYYVPGVGINTEKYTDINIDKAEKRKELNIPEDAVIAVSVGELNSNKNHELIIKALSVLKNPNIHYCIAGKGMSQEHLEKLAEDNGIFGNVHILGYRTDIEELLAVSDIFCFPSFREGLPVSLMEAMASGLPCVASRIRGNTDLISDGRNGFLISPVDAATTATAIDKIIKDRDMTERMKENNIEDIKSFDRNTVNKIMMEIYTKL